VIPRGATGGEPEAIAVTEQEWDSGFAVGARGPEGFGVAQNAKKGAVCAYRIARRMWSLLPVPFSSRTRSLCHLGL